MDLKQLAIYEMQVKGFAEAAAEFDRLTASQKGFADGSAVVAKQVETQEKSVTRISSKLESLTRSHNQVAKALSDVARFEQLVESARKNSLEVSEQTLVALDNLREKANRLKAAQDGLGISTESSADKNDRLRASISPLYDLETRHLSRISEIKSAVESGAVSYSTATSAVDRLSAAYERNYAAAAKEIQAPLNNRLGVRDDFGTERRGVDISAFGADLDAKEARLYPLRTAEKSYRQIIADIEATRHALGATDDEVAAAINRETAAYERYKTALSQGPAGAHLQRYELINLSRQFQDVAVSLQAGQNPLTVLIQQGAQIGDIFSAHGNGAGAALKEFGGIVTRFALNPITMLTAAIGGLSYAAYRYADQQEALTRSLNGVGRSSGASAGQLRSISDTAARSGSISQGQAVSAAAQYASAGIGVENIPTLLADTRRFSHAFGLDMDAAQKEIAQIVGEEGLGAFEKRFGSVSFATKEWVRALEQSGRFAEAAAVKTRMLDEETRKTKDAAGILSRVWETITSATGNAFGAIGSGIDALVPKFQRVELPRPAQAVAQAPGMGSLSDYERRIGLAPEVTPAQTERRLAELRRGSGLAGDVIDQFTPEEGQRRGNQRSLDLLRPFTESADGLAMLGDRAGMAKDVVARLTAALANFQTPAERMSQDNDLATRSIAAYSLEQRASIAAEQARVSTMRETNSELLANLAAEGARNAALAESRRRLDDMAREAEDRSQLRGLSPLQSSLREIETRYGRLREQSDPQDAGRVADLQRNARLDLLSQNATQTLDAARPDLAQLRQIKDAQDALQELLSDKDGLAALGPRADEARQALDNLSNRMSVWRSTADTILQDAGLSAKATEAYTFAQRQLVAQQQAWLAVMRQSGEAAQAAAAAEKARIDLIAQGNRAADDMLRSAKDQAELIGLSPLQAELKRNEQAYRRFLEQNVPTGAQVDYRTGLQNSPGATFPPAVLSPIETGFKSAGEAATRLADALNGAAGMIGAAASIPTSAATSALPMFARGGAVNDPRGLAPFIKDRAAAYGLNPAAVLRIAQSEGLSEFYGDKGTSFGALQLHVGGGLGDTFRKQTGLDPSDPRNEKMTIDWGLRYMAQTRDVSPWHGAARVGVTNADVFGGSPAPQSRVEPEARQALGLQNSVTLWSHLGSQIQSLDTEMQGHIRLIEAQSGALTANDSTLEGVVSAQQLANRLLAEGANIERDSVVVKRDGVMTTMRLKDAILEHGKAAGDVARKEEEAARVRSRYIAELDIGRGAINEGFTSPLKALARGENPGAAALSALQATQDRLIDFIGGQFTESLLGKTGSTNTGILGSLFGFGGQQDLAQATINAGVVNVNGGVHGAVGGAAGGSGGGLLGWLGNAVGSLFGGGAATTNEARVATGFYAEGGLVGRSSHVESVPARAFIGAPHFSDGGKVGRPAILHDGEIVLNAMQQRNLAERLAPQAPVIDVSRLMQPTPPMHVAPNYAAPAAAPIVVNVHEAPGVKAEVSETRDASGGRRIEVVMKEKVAEGIASPQGQEAIAAYGGRRRLAKL